MSAFTTYFNSTQISAEKTDKDLNQKEISILVLFNLCSSTFVCVQKRIIKSFEQVADLLRKGGLINGRRL